MGRSRNLAVAAVACALVLAALPAIAFGAPSATAIASPTAALAAGPIDAQIWPAQDGKNTAVIIDVTLDSKVKLPARVQIPVPKGAVVEWAGEILNGDASADKQRDFTLHDGAGGGTYAEFTLSSSHRGQIDTNGIALTASGTQLSTQVDWIQSVPSTSTLFTVRIPAGVSEVKIDPAPEGAPDTNSAGEKLYVLPVQALATGAATTVKVSYNTSPTGAASAAAGSTTVYIVLGVLLVGAFAAVAYLLSRQRAAGHGPDDTEDADSAVVADDADSDDSDAWQEDADDVDAHDSGRDAASDDDPFDIDFDSK